MKSIVNCFAFHRKKWVIFHLQIDVKLIMSPWFLYWFSDYHYISLYYRIVDNPYVCLHLHVLLEHMRLWLCYLLLFFMMQLDNIIFLYTCVLLWMSRIHLVGSLPYIFKIRVAFEVKPLRASLNWLIWAYLLT